MAMSANFDLVDSVLVLPPSFPSLAQMGSTAAVSDRDAARGDASRDACHMRAVPESPIRLLRDNPRSWQHARSSRYLTDVLVETAGRIVRVRGELHLGICPACAA